MKFSLACLSALAGFAFAQNDVQSKPFQLTLCTDDDKSLNGKTLSACHTGAAIESLCLTEGPGSKFRFNTTKGQEAEAKGYTASGKLVWDLVFSKSTPSISRSREIPNLIFPLAAGGKVSEPMYLSVEPSTNVALPLFTPSDTDIQYVAFDKKTEAMRIFSYLDDTKKPPKSTGAKALNRWYVCSTNYSGYQYKTLTWVLGNGKPQNPSCKKVDVKRKF